jgi:hypothetical protein
MSQKKEFLLGDKVKVEFNPADFISTVTGASGDDYIGIAMWTGGNRCSPRLRHISDEILYGSEILTRNCWFCGAVLDGKGNTVKNCLFTKSIILDIDYGKLGHKRPSPFPDYRSAVDYIYSQSIQPQIIWHTGHGIQMAFILDETVHFFDKTKLALYEKHKRCLNRIFRGDDTVSREHLYRMPLSLNIKPDCPAVKGEIIRWEVEQ